MRRLRTGAHKALLILAVSVMLVPAGPAGAQDETAVASGDVTLAATPPLGWNSWNRFGCDIDEDLIKETADAMVSSGMRDAGYRYVNLDDCWMATERNADGVLPADPERFPSGIAALADYVHDRGLKLGIYQSAGTTTCQRRPGSLGYEEIDARTWAEWGVDYLKYDNCGNQGIPGRERYAAMYEALQAAGRPIVYSICEWGSEQPWLWADEVGGDLWRTTFDIEDTFASILDILDQQVGLEQYSGPAAWNDPDMLQVGNGGMTTSEYQAHFSLWALLNAPLLAGNDLRDMSDETRDILTNREVIAIDQDWGGMQGHKLRDDGDTEVWVKPMSDGGAAVVLLNRGFLGAAISVTAKELGLASARGYEVRDVWEHTSTVSGGTVADYVAARSATTLRITPEGKKKHHGKPAHGRSDAPHISVDVIRDGYVQAGESEAFAVEVTNNGTQQIHDIQVRTSTGDTLTVRGGATRRRGALQPGRHLTVHGRLSADPDATVQVADLVVDVTYEWGHRTVQLQADADVFTVTPPPSGTTQVSTLPFVTATSAGGEVQRDRAANQNPLTVAGVTYPTGLGVRANSEIRLYLGESCSAFTSLAGVQDGGGFGGAGTVVFSVLGDGAELYRSELVRGGNDPIPIDVSVSGVEVLSLVVHDGDDAVFTFGDLGDWLSPEVTCD